MYVIGTAGHIDHGKSTLVKALTGIDPDRLREEKERGMTIDLGFAWLRLPSGREVSIVDVPGHERFIKNMLAGVGGIDLAVLVVAADEGFMPQTVEHLAILELLRVKRAVVAVTKRDLVEDDWLELVLADVEDRLGNSPLRGSPILPVSATTGQGLPELLRRLDASLDDTPVKPNRGRPRVPIDRVFTVSGFGTVVTGTLIDGQLRAGQELEILPGATRTRARGIQTHKTRVEAARPGERVAVNLGGVAVEEISRGMVLTTPGWLQPTSALDARIQVLASAPALVHNAAVSFYAGSAEANGRVRLLETDVILPGAAGWTQVVLDAPVALAKGDLFVIRNPNTTLGGGEVVEIHARRHRRGSDEVIERLSLLEKGSPEDLILQAANGRLGSDSDELARRSGLTREQAREIAAQLCEEGRLIPVGERVFSLDAFHSVRAAVEGELRVHHERFPLRPGIPREEVRSRLRLGPREAAALLDSLAERGAIVVEEATVRLPDHEVRFAPDQEARVAGFLAALAEVPYTPPALDEVAGRFGLDEEILSVLLARGEIVRVAENIAFHRDAFNQMRDDVVRRLGVAGTISVAEVRDQFNTSRKYALALMEYFDQQRLTRRVGDARVLR
ncbi:MAG TPA: selenocysteine-specific translation elongation factor [Chloroflexota bacterium]|nr:selenocysteine-specific translation elongation factor [Chloroflexota bacterium]